MKIYKNKKFKKILVLPDMHLPWVNWKAVQQAKRWKDKHKPDLVVCLGDITDQKIWSRWMKDIDDFSPSEEFLRAEEGIKKLHQWFPNMLILRGNHDNRILNKAIEAGIPSQMFKDIDEVFNFKGWTWISPTEKLIVDSNRGPILFVHGDEQGGTVAQKSRILGINVCQGHTHKASTTYTSSLYRSFWGAEMGCLMDIPSKASKYAASNPVGSTVGFGVIKYGVPYFIDYIEGSQV